MQPLKVTPSLLLTTSGGSGNNGCACTPKDWDTSQFPSLSDIESSLVLPVDGTAKSSSTMASKSVLEVGEPVEHLRQGNNLTLRFLLKFREVGGRFRFFKKDMKKYPDGLDAEACSHPFVVVDCQTRKNLLGVCIIRAFSELSPGTARGIADRNWDLIPIWPNGKSSCAYPSVVSLVDRNTTPRPSWINVKKFFYVEEECFETYDRGRWGELRLRYSDINLIRGLLHVDDDPGPSFPQIPLSIHYKQRDITVAGTNVQRVAATPKVVTLTEMAIAPVNTELPCALDNSPSVHALATPGPARRRGVGQTSTANTLPTKIESTTPENTQLPCAVDSRPSIYALTTSGPARRRGVARAFPVNTLSTKAESTTGSTPSAFLLKDPPSSTIYSQPKASSGTFRGVSSSVRSSYMALIQQLGG